MVAGKSVGWEINLVQIIPDDAGSFPDSGFDDGGSFDDGSFDFQDAHEEMPVDATDPTNVAGTPFDGNDAGGFDAGDAPGGGGDMGAFMGDEAAFSEGFFDLANEFGIGAGMAGAGTFYDTVQDVEYVHCVAVVLFVLLNGRLFWRVLYAGRLEALQLNSGARRAMFAFWSGVSFFLPCGGRREAFVRYTRACMRAAAVFRERQPPDAYLLTECMRRVASSIVLIVVLEPESDSFFSLYRAVLSLFSNTFQKVDPTFPARRGYIWRRSERFLAVQRCRRRFPDVDGRGGR